MIVFICMKTPKILPIFAAIFAAGLCASAQDALTENLDLARASAWSAYKHYNESLRLANSAISIADKAAYNYKDTLELQRLFDSIQNKGAGLCYEIDLVKTQFEAQKNFLESSKTNLEALKKFLPLGEKRVKLGESLAAQALEIVEKDPDKEHADKAYITRLASVFEQAKSDFLAAQNEISELNIVANISTPQIEGIQNMIALTGDAAAKASKTMRENETRISLLKEETEKLKAQTLKLGDAANKASAGLRRLKIAFAGEYAELISFMANVLPQNEKYAETVYKPNRALKIAVLADASAYAGAAVSRLNRARVGGVKSKEAEGEVFGMSADGKYAPRASNLIKRINALGDDALDAPKISRKELLDLASRLSAVICELKEYAAVLNSISIDANKAISAIGGLEESAKSNLQKAMGILNDAQMLSSSIEIFKGSLNVAKSQLEASQTQFAGVGEKAEASAKECAKETKKIAEYLKKAKAAIGK